jgi:hypothetical protein
LQFRKISNIKKTQKNPALIWICGIDEKTQETWMQELRRVLDELDKINGM